MSSFLSNLVSAATAVGQKVIQNTGINNPFSVGERIDNSGNDSSNSSIWSIHKGIKKDDSSQITVLAFDCVKQRQFLPLAKNMLKRFRTIRHPNIVKFIDCIEVSVRF